MKVFLDDNFLLKTKTAQHLYHHYAAAMPILDYHCHLSPKDIAEDRRFKTISEVWLYGDHYKWRAMRANGIDESYCTGQQSDKDKFIKWSETVPYTLRNPLYHWTHLELKRYFGVDELLGPDNAEKIYDHCNALLQKADYSVRGLLKKMHVQLVCTTDDPVDDLVYHKRIREEGDSLLVLPAFRPDNAMQTADPVAFAAYVKRLEAASGKTIADLDDFMHALRLRHDFFAQMGCRVSDHGLEEISAEEYTDLEIRSIFSALKKGTEVALNAQRKFKSAMLVFFAMLDYEKGWVQQYHLGAIRNNNARMKRLLGPDTGWDSIGHFDHGTPLSRFLNGLDERNMLTKTIVYNLNPADNELMASMIGNFNDGSVPGKIQYGAAWWFLDQKDGMTRQINALSNMGLLSRFVGMLTDSRSFLSFPRHEYFRRILCDILGDEVEQGELPDQTAWIGKMVKDICYYNNLNYFGWHLE